MAYMLRLGLWGVNHPSFPKFHTFLNEVSKQGVGGMELIAMEMKARGMYVCRTLSFTGAEFSTDRVSLSDKMVEVYGR